ncbi:MAG: hypothetical protein MZU97_01040 [Bacillus subtilis]|nr:hypothetical protein [Bacillus subtilis]
MLASLTFDATTITLTFDHVGNGLKLIKNAVLGVLTMEVVLKNGQRQTVDCRIISTNQVRISGVDTTNVASSRIATFHATKRAILPAPTTCPRFPSKFRLV